MNKNIIRIVLVAVVSVLIYSCKDESKFSENYDITLPAATVTSISNETPFVGKQITFKGTNMKSVSSVSIGAYTFKIIGQYNDSLRVEVPRVIESGAITLMNKYKRQYVTTQILKPQFYVAKVTSWPANIERGKPFLLKGENLDLIKEVKIAGKVVSVFGSVAPDKVSYSSAGVDLGEASVIEITPKAGEKQTSAAIPVIAPKNTYMPKQTIMLFDFETAPVVVAGDATQPFTQEIVNNGFFNKAYKVTAAAGNGWNGIYTKLQNTNGGQGFDLSAYTKPTLTLLVNTNGGQGYVQPLITIGGSTADKHLTGAFGYGDDYKIKTTGWEWRSYDLEKMGYANIKGLVSNFTMQFRGGNVNGTPFEIMIDQVMITDGPLNPTLAWDCEAAPGVEFTNWKLAAKGSAPSLTGYIQGSGYSVATGISTGWNDKLGRAAFAVKALDPVVYANGIWVNFLVNTGSKEGYFQFGFGSGWMHFTKSNGYGDDYKFVPTGNKWVWRSIKIVPGEGDLKSFDSTKDFTMDITLYGGNIANGTPMEVNVDYFVFTTVPLDPNLKTE
ncbi:MAG: hypothetical protein JZU47_12630 [Prolixibacteraceae bacterium]|nr:hypothetical protein [Prolixibacteraceae bacterium]